MEKCVPTPEIYSVKEAKDRLDAILTALEIPKSKLTRRRLAVMLKRFSKINSGAYTETFLLGTAIYYLTLLRKQQQQASYARSFKTSRSVRN